MSVNRVSGRRPANFDINAKLDGAAPVQFRFTAPKGSGWLLDDFYVDPRYRG